MIKDKLEKLVNDTAEALGYMVYEFSFFFKGKNTSVNVKIDSMTGISHDDCDIYSKELSLKLDEAEIFANYILEVSSPGINRKIRNSEEFKRFTGAPVKVVFSRNGEKSFFKGFVLDVLEASVKLTDKKTEIEIPYTDIEKANLDY